jgi:hypothetical protein
MGKSSGGGGGTQVQKIEPSDLQAPYLSDLYSQSQNLYNQGGITPFPDRTFAPVSDDTINAEAALRRLSAGDQQTMVNNIANAQNFALAGPQNLATNPYLAGATEAALRPIYGQTQGLLQQARRGATGAGQLDGSRQAILEQGVISDYLTKAGDISSKMYSDAYKDAALNQQRALAYSPQTLQTLTTPAATLASLGLAQEGRQQQQIDENMARYMAQQQQPIDAINQYNAIVGQNTPFNTTTGTMNAADPSFGQRAIGGLASGFGASQLAGATIAGSPVFGSTVSGLATPIGLAVGIGSALGLFD